MHITTVSFNLSLKENHLPFFKQAILDLDGLDHRIYNNKINVPEGDGQTLHRYPPIQYRVLDGYATLWALNEGALQLEEDLKTRKLSSIFWRGQVLPLQLIRHFRYDSAKAEYLGPDQFVTYRLSNYLPLSNHTGGNRKQSTHQEYEQAQGFADKIEILERIITSHLLLFSYAAGWALQKEQRLTAKIMDLKDISSGVYKKEDAQKQKYFKKFDLEVAINARLPEGIALGNQVALGYGVLQGREEAS